MLGRFYYYSVLIAQRIILVPEKAALAAFSIKHLSLNLGSEDWLLLLYCCCVHSPPFLGLHCYTCHTLWKRFCKTRSRYIVNPHRNPYYFSYSKLPEAAIRSITIFLSRCFLVSYS